MITDLITIIDHLKYLISIQEKALPREELKYSSMATNSRSLKTLLVNSVKN